MITLDASGANPPGTYKPTRLTGIMRRRTTAPGATLTSPPLSPSSVSQTRRRRSIAVAKAFRRSGCSRVAAVSNAVLGTEGGRKHSIETHRVVSQPSRDARDVGADRPNDLGRGGHIEIGSGHNGGVVQPLPGRPPAAKIDHPKHGEILRPRRRVPTRYSRSAGLLSHPSKRP